MMTREKQYNKEWNLLGPNRRGAVITSPEKTRPVPRSVALTHTESEYTHNDSVYLQKVVEIKVAHLPEADVELHVIWI